MIGIDKFQNIELTLNNKYFPTKTCFIKAIDNFLYTAIPKISQDLYTNE
jgi:hypothetical protein